MAEECREERSKASLGRFGILHLCRSEALEAVNTAALRGVVVQVITQLNPERSASTNNPSIEIRHADELT